MPMRVRVVASGFVQAEPDDAHPNTGLTHRFGRGPMEFLTRSNGGWHEAISRSHRAHWYSAVLGLGTLSALSADADSRGNQSLPGIIVFQRFDANDNFQVWVANADLSNQRQITSGDLRHRIRHLEPGRNPDRRRLLFSAPDPTHGNDVLTMNPDGTDVVRVTNFLWLDSVAIQVGHPMVSGSRMSQMWATTPL